MRIDLKSLKKKGFVVLENPVQSRADLERMAANLGAEVMHYLPNNFLIFNEDKLSGKNQQLFYAWDDLFQARENRLRGLPLQNRAAFFKATP